MEARIQFRLFFLVLLCVAGSFPTQAFSYFDCLTVFDSTPPRYEPMEGKTVRVQYAKDGVRKSAQLVFSLEEDGNRAVAVARGRILQFFIKYRYSVSGWREIQNFDVGSPIVALARTANGLHTVVATVDGDVLLYSGHQPRFRRRNAVSPSLKGVAILGDGEAAHCVMADDKKLYYHSISRDQFPSSFTDSRETYEVALPYPAQRSAVDLGYSELGFPYAVVGTTGGVQAFELRKKDFKVIPIHDPYAPGKISSVYFLEGRVGRGVEVFAFDGKGLIRYSLDNTNETLSRQDAMAVVTPALSINSNSAGQLFLESLNGRRVITVNNSSPWIDQFFSTIP